MFSASSRIEMALSGSREGPYPVAGFAQFEIAMFSVTERMAALALL